MSRLMRWLTDHVSYDGDACLTWPFSRMPNGRGRIFYGGDSTGAHRVMCILAHGDPPTPSHEAAHRCGNGHLGCVHPGHLWWATHAQNMAEMVSHGRSQRGTRGPTNVLSEEDVQSIRSMRSDGLRKIDIQRVTGFTYKVIDHVIQRRSWKWL